MLGHGSNPAHADAKQKGVFTLRAEVFPTIVGCVSTSRFHAYSWRLWAAARPGTAAKAPIALLKIILDRFQK
jgi:hypothetical protein